jgi:hypothetical protein
MQRLSVLVPDDPEVVQIQRDQTANDAERATGEHSAGADSRAFRLDQAQANNDLAPVLSTWRDEPKQEKPRRRPVVRWHRRKGEAGKAGILFGNFVFLGLRSNSGMRRYGDVKSYLRCEIGLCN